MGNVHCQHYSRTGVFVHGLANGTNQVTCYNNRGQYCYKVTVPRDCSAATWQTSCSYSAEGDLLAVEGAGGTTRYSYDVAHRLVRKILPTGQEREFRSRPGDNLIRQPGLEDMSLQEGNRLTTSEESNRENDQTEPNAEGVEKPLPPMPSPEGLDELRSDDLFISHGRRTFRTRR